MNERDMHGCTPLHYASKAGNMRSIPRGSHFM